MTIRLNLFLGVWAICLLLAFALDQWITTFFYNLNFHDPKAGLMKGTLWAEIIKMPGDLRYVIPLLVILVLLKLLSWKQGLITLLCSFTSVLATVFKFIAGRPRPVIEDNLIGAFQFYPLTFDGFPKAFPSGHTMLAFATAVCLARYYPRGAFIFYAIAAMVAVERVIEVSHFPSDVVFAAGLAILVCTWCMNRLDAFFRQDEAMPIAQLQEIR